MTRRKEDRLRSFDLSCIPPSQTRAVSDGISRIGDQRVWLAAYAPLERREPEWLRRYAVTKTLIESFRNAEAFPVPPKFSTFIEGRKLSLKQPLVFIHGSWENRTRVGVLSQIQNSVFQEENATQQLKRVVEGTLKMSPHPGDPRSRAGDLMSIVNDIVGTPAKGKSQSILFGYAIGAPFICATFNPEAGEAGLLPTGVLDQSRLEKNLFDYWTRVSQRGVRFVAVIEIDELCALLNFVLVKRLEASFSASSQSEIPFVRVINPYFLSEVISTHAPLEYLKTARRDKSPHQVIEYSLSRLETSGKNPRARQTRV